MGLVEDGTAGSFVHAPALHAHQPVFHDVQQANAVGPTQLVELQDHALGGQLLPVHGNGNALFEVDGHIGGLVRGIQGADPQLQEAGLFVLGLVARILQVQALVAQVPQVFVLGVVGLPVDLQGDVVGLGVLDLLLPGLDAPLPPGGDDGHIGGEVLDGQLKPDLVVALAGAAVADGIGSLLLGDLHQGLGDAGPGMGGTQQILLVDGPGLEAGHDIVGGILFRQVQHIELAGTGGDGLLLQALQFVRLAHIAGDGDDLAAPVVLLQPGDDHGCVQSAGVGEDDFFNRIFIHGNCLHCVYYSLIGCIIYALTRKVKYKYSLEYTRGRILYV